MTEFMFWFFASLTVLGAILVAFLKRLVNSAFALAMTLVGVAGLYWTLGADFLGTTQVLVYVGGVTVLILYGVMLTPKDSTKVPWIRFVPALALTAAVGFLIYSAWAGVEQFMDSRAGHIKAIQPTAEEIGRSFLEREKYLVPFELASVLLLIVVVGAVFIARRRKEV